jgi:hypothetical protein
VLGVALVAVLGACTHQRSIPDSYGSTTEDNFIEGCVDTLTSTSDDVPGDAYTDDEANAICTCSYEAISDPDTGIPFDEFKEINEAQEEDPTALPPEIADPVEACADQAGSPS